MAFPLVFNLSVCYLFVFAHPHHMNNVFTPITANKKSAFSSLHVYLESAAVSSSCISVERPLRLMGVGFLASPKCRGVDKSLTGSAQRGTESFADVI